MKTLQQIAVLLLVFCICSVVNAQVKPQKITVKKNDKKVYTAKTLVNTKAVTTLKKEENMCKPMDIRGTEKILRERVGRTLNIKLDKDYGFVEIMGTRQNLNFSDYKVKKAGNDWVYTLNNINSTLTRVEYKNSLYVLNVSFETDDSEIKGRCPGCRVGKDKRAPDIQWKDPSLIITLKPTVYNGSFTFEVQRVYLGGDFDFNGVMDKFLPSVTRFFQNQMEKAFKNHMQRTFNSGRVKQLLANAFKGEVQKLGISTVKNVDMSRHKIYLCNY
tara:strand:+ start:5145 stop:5963 length:819 start_codon:yes stop_codon:yes gene_type:complete